MAFLLIEAGAGRAAQSSFDDPDAALAAARAAWARGGMAVVRLLDASDRLVWKRGTCPNPETEAADNAALAAAAGTARLRLACPEIGGLHDLDRPIAPFAATFALALGDADEPPDAPADAPADAPLPTESGAILRGANGSAKLRDLIAHLDARLQAEGRDATLTAFRAVRCDWPNRAHHRLDVTLAP